MAKRQPPEPLTAAEIALAKRVNCWIGNQKEFSLPSDSRGNQFSTKNLGDNCDRYLAAHEERIMLEGAQVDRDQLLKILWRYRARKSANRRAINKRKAKRLLSAQQRKAEAAEKAAKKAAEKARQYQFEL